MAFVMLERDSLEPDARPRNEQSSLERGVGSSKIEGLRGTTGSPSTGFLTRRRRLSASFWRRATRLSTRLSSATRAAAVSRSVLACVSMDFTSSCTELTATSAASTGAAVTWATTGAAATGLATGAAAFFAAFAGFATSTAATTGVATTGAAVFVALETDFLAAGVAELIILGAVELFMAGIRIHRSDLHSIFGPYFIFAGIPKIL